MNLKMNLELTNKQALELVVFLKKENILPIVAKQIDTKFKNMEVSDLLEIHDSLEVNFTIEFYVVCVKCSNEFLSVAVRKNKAPEKHTAKCPNCLKKHKWYAN